MDGNNNVKKKVYDCKNHGCLHIFSSPIDLARHKCSSNPSSTKARKKQKLRETAGNHNAAPINMDVLEPNNRDGIKMDEHGEGKSEEVPDPRGIVIDEFCKLVAYCTDYKTLKVLKTVISLLHNESFDLGLFRSEIKTLESCRVFVSSKFSEKAAKDGFKKNVVQYSDGNEIHKAEFFQRDILTVLKKQVAAASETDILLTPQNKSNSHITHPLESSFFQNQYINRKRQVMKDVRSNVVWYDGSERKSFVGFLQVFTDKTVTSLKVGSVTAYVVHVTLLNATKKFRRKLIQSGKTIVGFLPTGVTETSINNSSNGNNRKVTELVNMEIDGNEDGINCTNMEGIETGNADQEIVELLDKVLLTSNTRGRITKLGLTHEAMKQILQPLLTVSTVGFDIAHDGLTLVCYPMLISYCCDIPEAKDMSAVRHNMNTKCPCHRCLSMLSSIESFTKAPIRHHKDTFKIRMDIQSKFGATKTRAQNEKHDNKMSGTEQSIEILKQWSLSPKPSFLEDII